MLVKTIHSINQDLLTLAQEQLPNFDFKLSLNKPTNTFFYDKWEIKDEFKNTVWEQILNSLPYSIGEARLINLKPTNCYTCHGDIDDRWHLNITGGNSYIVDLSTDTMYKQLTDCNWYIMDAGPIHSAVNFHNRDRIQLVVRKLLTHCDNTNHVNVEVTPVSERSDLRFMFDQNLSTWLNRAVKRQIIDNFENHDPIAKFSIHKDYIEELKHNTPNTHKVEIK